MSGRKKIYEVLIEGARTGLAGDALYAHVTTTCSKASSKKIVRASLLALTDPDVKDASVLESIYALAIKHRLDPVSDNDRDRDEDDEDDKDVKDDKDDKDDKPKKKGKA